MLGIVTYYHTGGQTPRHFNFDPSGQFSIIANQDTDTLVGLNFNQSSGEPSFLHSYPIPSPNFVLATEAHPQVERGADNNINVAATDTVYARL
jgi:6-phosphogluconolactonase (cycloisomerase 2 family)